MGLAVGVAEAGVGERLRGRPLECVGQVARLGRLLGPVEVRGRVEVAGHEHRHARRPPAPRAVPGTARSAASRVWRSSSSTSAAGLAGLDQVGAVRTAGQVHVLDRDDAVAGDLGVGKARPRRARPRTAGSARSGAWSRRRREGRRHRRAAAGRPRAPARRRRRRRRRGSRAATWPKSTETPPYQMLKVITRSSTEPAGALGLVARSAAAPAGRGRARARTATRSAVRRRIFRSSQH